MTGKPDDIEGLEERLHAAWRQAPVPQPAADWKREVLAAVRSEAPERDSLERLVRNGFLAAVAAAVLAVVGATAAGVSPSDELGNLITSNAQSVIDLVLVL